MFLVTSLILFCFYFGFFLSNLLSANIDRHAKYESTQSYVKKKSTLFNFARVKPISFCNCGVLFFSHSHFDPRIPKLPLHIDENLQQIFDIVLGRFIFRWFALLTDDEEWLIEVKAELQHICSVIFLRLKTVNISNLVEEKLLPCIVHHVEHLLALTKVFSHLDVFFKSANADEVSFRPPSTDEVVLQRLFSAGHLHHALQSRQAESLYLQGIVRQLLPCLLSPPGLKGLKRVGGSNSSAKNGVFHVTTVMDQAFSSAQFYHQMPKQTTVQNTPPVDHDISPNHTQMSQCARTFLTEIIANHVLLPALDSIANPDSLNSVILYLLDPAASDIDYPPNPPMVPLLNSYVNEWFEHTKELPPNMRMEALLQQPKQLANFVQYMKTINCSATMTALLLMFEVVNKIETESVSLALCERLKVPLHQLLCLLHSGRVWTSEELERRPQQQQQQQQQQQPDNPRCPSRPHTVCRECGRAVSPSIRPCLSQLLGLPIRLTEVIAEAIDSVSADANSDPFCVARLVHTPEWINAYKTMCATMEAVYLPMYLSSPEFLRKMGASSTPSSPKSPCFSLNDATWNSEEDMGDIFGASDCRLGRPFYKVPKQSNSFADINDLNRRSGTRRSNSIAMDDMSVTTVRSFAPSKTSVHGSSCLQIQQHLAPTTPVETATTTAFEMEAEMEDLDFSKWRVSIPCYTPSNTSARLSENGDGSYGFRSSAPKAITGSKSIVEEPEFSFFSLIAPNKGYYTVIAEREVKGKKVTSRVNRKYAEFYVLEQRLVEFHGSQISRRMRPRRLGAQSRHFVENMKIYFERFLKYLLSQPFLRTSELIHRFLTSHDVQFTSGNLSDIRLGKFVKSVPILLAKEKGQFTDEFLTAFRASCFLPTSSTAATANHPKNNAQTPHSALEHRLHSQTYWNNAAIPILQKQACSFEYCAMEGAYVTSFYDFFGYLVDNLRSLDSEQSFSKATYPDLKSGTSSVYTDFLHWAQRLALVCWANLQNLWYEMLRAVGLPYNPPVTSTIGVQSYLQSLLCRAVLNLGLVFRETRFGDFVDLHVRLQVERFLQLLGRNDYLAPMLLLLRDSVFFPSPPRNKQGKAARREEAAARLRRLTDHFRLQWFSEDDRLQRRLDRVFEMFQHGKWNKQLVYTLLDHILLELFPDVFVSSAVSEPTTLPLE